VRVTGRTAAVLAMIALGMLGATLGTPVGAQPRGFAGFDAVLSDPQTAQQLTMPLAAAPDGPPHEQTLDGLYPNDDAIMKSFGRAGFSDGARAAFAQPGVIAGTRTTYPSGSFAYVTASLSEFRTAKGAKRAFDEFVRYRRNNLESDATVSQRKVRQAGLDQAVLILVSAPGQPGTRSLVELIGRHGTDLFEFGAVGSDCSAPTVTAQQKAVQDVVSAVAQRIG
jgi:hypothetical protein